MTPTFLTRVLRLLVVLLTMIGTSRKERSFRGRIIRSFEGLWNLQYLWDFENSYPVWSWRVRIRTPHWVCSRRYVNGWNCPVRKLRGRERKGADKGNWAVVSKIRVGKNNALVANRYAFEEPRTSVKWSKLERRFAFGNCKVLITRRNSA